MTHSFNAHSILSRIGYLDSGDTPQYPLNDNRDCFFVIPGNNGPRWLLPNNESIANKVLISWKPYGLLSLIKWYLIRKAYTFKLLSKLPFVDTIPASLKYCKIPGSNTELIPIIYIGTPGPQQKAVIILVNRSTGEPSSVMKIALSPGAKESLENEVRILNLLSNKGVKNIPRIQAVEQKSKRSWQSVVPGKLSSKKFTQHHVDWLLKLPLSGEYTTLDQQRKLLEIKFEERKFHFSTSQIKTLKKGISYIKGSCAIPLLLSHGDFAPWNIKSHIIRRKKELFLMDWEDANVNSLPLWDISHFFLIQSYLFNKPRLINDLFKNHQTQKYIKEVGINNVNVKCLTLIYILITSLSKKNNTSVHYKEFLINIINKVIKQ